MTVTVVTCVYGTQYGEFIDRWADSVEHLQPAPDHVIVASDSPYTIPCAETLMADYEGHPQAFYQQLAVTHADTDWVWPLDIDDLAIPNALRGLDKVKADVWQMGFDRSDGEMYLPPQLTNRAYLAQSANVYVGSSAIRCDAFHAAGGIPDIALQDWGLWRRMARNGAKFESSGRVHFRYMRHPLTRGENELTTADRPEHLAEMMEAERAFA